MYNKVLLINPKYRNLNGFPDYPAIGLGYLAESLQKEQIQCRVIDLRLGYSMGYLQNAIKEYNPDLIGISMMSYCYQDTYNMITLLKKKFNNIPIVAGGAHISILKEKALEECRAIDFGIIQDGEISLAMLCKGEKISDIPGLIYRDNRKISINSHENLIKDLNKIDFPKYEAFELKKYALPMAISIITSRGCPYSCTFCANSLTNGKKFRFRTAMNIIEEIKFWHEKGIRHFSIQDDNFTLDKNRVMEFCELIKSENLNNIKLELTNGIRANTADKELLLKMKEAGFFSLAIGVEAGNNKVLKSLNKSETMEEIEKAIKIACELNLNVHLFFLIGSPYETFDDFQDSIKLALKYPVSHVEFYTIVPYPGTGLFEWINENNYFVKAPKEYLNNASPFENFPCFATPEFSLKERKIAFRYAKRTAKLIKQRNIAKRMQKMNISASAIFVISSVYTLNFIQKVVSKSSFLKKKLYKMKEKHNL